MNCNLNKSVKCPICGSNSCIAPSYPYSTKYNGIVFTYIKCISCSSIFVNPIPDDKTLKIIYARSNYHDVHYTIEDKSSYSESAKLLSSYLPSNSLVLDYGCGMGYFLNALLEEGLLPIGVEFDEEAAKSASKIADCDVYPISSFLNKQSEYIFDAIHFGDVLEHLPDVTDVLNNLLLKLKSGGILFVEGPLESNPSFVYWSSKIFGMLKKYFTNKTIYEFPPTHLYRVSAAQQLSYFKNLDCDLELLYFRIYETGWPYYANGFLKNIIARIAIVFGGHNLFGFTFGNRIQCVLKKR